MALQVVLGLLGKAKAPALPQAVRPA